MITRYAPALSHIIQEAQVCSFMASSLTWFTSQHFILNAFEPFMFMTPFLVWVKSSSCFFGRLRSVGFLASLFHWEVSLRVAPRWLSPVRRIPALPLRTGGISCSSSWYHPLCAAPRRIILQPLLCQETPGAHLCFWRHTNFLSVSK